MLSREDLAAKLYSAGIKNPRILRETQRWIDVYCLQQMRKAQDQEDVTPSFTELEPGQWSAALEVTCCARCQQVKRWDYYHVDKRHATGHKIVCKECRKKEDEELGNPPYIPENVRRGGWLCISIADGGCGERRAPVEFPEAKREKPRRAVLCNFCEKEKNA
jgi:hypothetical protein